MLSSAALVILLLLILLVLLFSSIVKAEVAALLLCASFAGLGYLKDYEIFSGFSSNAVVTVVCSFFIAGALRKTGIAEAVGRVVLKISANSESSVIANLMLFTAFFSSFMNNVAAAALMFPSAMYISHARAISPNKLLMPLSFAAVLGGMLTLIGTPPNLLASEILKSNGYLPLYFFDFTFFGMISCLIGGAIFTFGYNKFLPRSIGTFSEGRKELPEIYKLYEKLFALQIPEASSLVGHTLESLQFGGVLGVRVLGIISRAGRKTFSPSADYILNAGDKLIVGGAREEIATLVKFDALETKVLNKSLIPEGLLNIYTAEIQIEDRLIVGKSLKEIRFSDRYGVMVLAIERNSQVLYHDLSSYQLERGDILHVIGPHADLLALAKRAEVKIVGSLISIANPDNRTLCEVKLPTASALDQETIRSSRMGELFGLTALGIIREGKFYFALDGLVKLQSEDGIVVVGDRERLARMQKFTSLTFGEKISHRELETNTHGFFEAVLMPRSSLIGRTLAEINFRRRFDLDVLAIWRQGAPIQSHLEKISLKFGDALLIRGTKSKAKILQSEGDLIVTSEVLQNEYRRDKAAYAIIAVLILVICPIFNLASTALSSLLAALVVLLGGAYLIEEAYKEIEWRIVFYVAALIPTGIVLQRVGVVDLFSEYLKTVALEVGPYGVSFLLCIVASAISQFLDAIIAITLVLPVAISVGASIGMDVRALALSLTIASSTAFITPFSHKAHMLVMSAAGYKNSDYLLVGSILSVILLMIAVFLVPNVF